VAAIKVGVGQLFEPPPVTAAADAETIRAGEEILAGAGG